MAAKVPELVGLARAAQFLGVSRQVLRRWNKAGLGPPRRRIGRRYYYARVLLVEWLKSNAPPTAQKVEQPARNQAPASRMLLQAPVSMMSLSPKPRW